MRDEIFANKVIAGFGRRAMVIGGFHTEGVREIFQKAGISYTVITPNISHDIAQTLELYRRAILNAAQTRQNALALPSVLGKQKTAQAETIIRSLNEISISGGSINQTILQNNIEELNRALAEENSSVAFNVHETDGALQIGVSENGTEITQIMFDLNGNERTQTSYSVLGKRHAGTAHLWEWIFAMPFVSVFLTLIAGISRDGDFKRAIGFKPVMMIVDIITTIVPIIMTGPMAPATYILLRAMIFTAYHKRWTWGVLFFGVLQAAAITLPVAIVGAVTVPVAALTGAGIIITAIIHRHINVKVIDKEIARASRNFRVRLRHLSRSERRGEFDVDAIEHVFMALDDIANVSARNAGSAKMFDLNYKFQNFFNILNLHMKNPRIRYSDKTFIADYTVLIRESIMASNMDLGKLGPLLDEFIIQNLRFLSKETFKAIFEVPQSEVGNLLYRGKNFEWAGLKSFIHSRKNSQIAFVLTRRYADNAEFLQSLIDSYMSTAALKLYAFMLMVQHGHAPEFSESIKDTARDFIRYSLDNGKIAGKRNVSNLLFRDEYLKTYLTALWLDKYDTLAKAKDRHKNLIIGDIDEKLSRQIKAVADNTRLSNKLIDRNSNRNADSSLAFSLNNFENNFAQFTYTAYHELGHRILSYMLSLRGGWWERIFRGREYNMSRNILHEFFAELTADHAMFRHGHPGLLAKNEWSYNQIMRKMENLKPGERYSIDGSPQHTLGYTLQYILLSNISQQYEKERFYEAAMAVFESYRTNRFRLRVGIYGYFRKLLREYERRTMTLRQNANSGIEAVGDILSTYSGLKSFFTSRFGTRFDIVIEADSEASLNSPYGRGSLFYSALSGIAQNNLLPVYNGESASNLINSPIRIKNIHGILSAA
ncbi:MAG: hypothetical protein FWC85_02830, partial [Elusimicrobia bacterium]|nr:hypothetical protein [Elusimicrobiota bacterium]